MGTKAFNFRIQGNQDENILECNLSDGRQKSKYPTKNTNDQKIKKIRNCYWNIFYTYLESRVIKDI